MFESVGCCFGTLLQHHVDLEVRAHAGFYGAISFEVSERKLASAVHRAIESLAETLRIFCPTFSTALLPCDTAAPMPPPNTPKLVAAVTLAGDVASLDLSTFESDFTVGISRLIGASQDDVKIVDIRAASVVVKFETVVADVAEAKKLAVALESVEKDTPIGKFRATKAIDDIHISSPTRDTLPPLMQAETRAPIPEPQTCAACVGAGRSWQVGACQPMWLGRCPVADAACYFDGAGCVRLAQEAVIEESCRARDCAACLKDRRCKFLRGGQYELPRCVGPSFGHLGEADIVTTDADCASVVDSSLDSLDLDDAASRASTPPWMLTRSRAPSLVPAVPTARQTAEPSSMQVASQKGLTLPPAHKPPGASEVVIVSRAAGIGSGIVLRLLCMLALLVRWSAVT